jgi:5-methylcytosine-specific restriction endonuclease McrA
MSLKATGRKHTPEAIENIRLAKTGAKYPNRKRYSRGITQINKICLYCKTPFITNSRQPRKKYCSLTCFHKTDNPNFTTLGKKGSEKQREIMRNRKGELHNAWIKDRNIVMEKHRYRGTTEWKTWRMEVFSRDKYTCQECGDSGVFIEPHHIIPLRVSFEKIFDVSNGITLCRTCHQKTIRKEENFTERYSQKVLTKL